MNSILEKLSSYNIFNNLMPGLLFLGLNDKLINTKFLDNSITIILVFSYFVGIVISRIGSIVIAPILYKFTKEKGEKYNNYIKACQKDSKIDILMQDRNMYRSICSLLIILLLEKVGIIVLQYIKINNNVLSIIIIFILIIIFSKAFLKQNKTISERIRANQKK